MKKNIIYLLTIILMCILLSINAFADPSYGKTGAEGYFDGDVGVSSGSGYYINGVLFSTAGLIDISTLAKTDGGIIVGDGTNFVLETGSTARASLGIDLSLYYLKTEVDTLNKLEAIYTKNIIDSDELAALKFTDLDDTPANYTGSANKFLQVNATPDAVIFDIITAGDLPTAVVSDGDTTHVPTSDNVYDFCETTQGYLTTEADPTVDSDAKIKAILVNEITKTGDFTANRLPEIDNSTGILKQSDIEHKTNGGYDFNANSAGFTTQTAVGDGDTTCDWRTGLKFRFVFGAQDETFTFTNPEFSCHLQIILIQDATGGRIATWPAGIWCANGVLPTLSTDGNARDIVNFFFDDYDDVYYLMGTGFAIP